MLKSIEPLSRLRYDQSERFYKLETLCKRSYFNVSEVYEMGCNKEIRRNEISNDLSSEVSIVEPSRLLSLLGQALKYQQSEGILLSTGASYDLFHGNKKYSKTDSEELIIHKEIEILSHGIKETMVSSLSFSLDGQSFSLSGINGFLEFWDVESLKYRNDLSYQQNGHFLSSSLDSVTGRSLAVLCSLYSKDNDHIAVGYSNGSIKIFRISSGICMKTFGQAHRDGILSLSFSKDGTQLLTSSFDMTARIHGMKSGKTLKEFRFAAAAVVVCDLFHFLPFLLLLLSVSFSSFSFIVFAVLFFPSRSLEVIRPLSIVLFIQKIIILLSQDPPMVQ
jgi:WD40 repeat-containing protein SMU1